MEVQTVYLWFDIRSYKYLYMRAGGDVMFMKIVFICKDELLELCLGIASCRDYFSEVLSLALLSQKFAHCSTSLQGQCRPMLIGS